MADTASFSMSDGGSSRQASVPGITKTNWLNLAMYVANCTVTYVSISGIFGQTNTALSKKYQTLVTPAGWAFSIWGPIFIWEGVFAIVQMLPRFRGLESVQKVAPWWWAACTFQILWSLAFAQDAITVAFMLMVSILVSLMGLLWFGDSTAGSVQEYWLIRAPFSLHAGWIVAATAVNLSVEADAKLAGQSTLLIIAITSLGAVFSVAPLATFAIPLPNPVICFVSFWAFMGIYSELREATNLKDATRYNFSIWPQVVLDGVQGAALIFSCAALAMMVIAAVRRVMKVPEIKGSPTPPMDESRFMGA